MTTQTTTDALTQATATYLARKDRTAHPTGEFDKRGRWYASATESQSCCAGIRTPSAAYPYSEMIHCRTIEHVAALHGVEAAALRRAVRAARPPARPRREGGDDYYKAVALVDGRLLSIYDGDTEYRVGETLSEPAHQGHGGGYYAYATPEQAALADVPSDSTLRDAPRVIIRVRGEGSYCRYDGDKLSFSRLTPLEIVGVPDVDYGLWPIVRIVPLTS